MAIDGDPDDHETDRAYALTGTISQEHAVKSFRNP